MTWRYFQNGPKVHAYDDETQGALIATAIASGWPQFAEAPVPPPPTVAQLAAAALARSDSTMHRIAEGQALGLIGFAAADVQAWMHYRRTLRALATGGPGEMPVRPPYPEGT